MTEGRFSREKCLIIIQLMFDYNTAKEQLLAYSQNLCNALAFMLYFGLVGYL